MSAPRRSVSSLVVLGVLSMAIAVGGTPAYADPALRASASGMAPTGGIDFIDDIVRLGAGALSKARSSSSGGVAKARTFVQHADGIEAGLGSDSRQLVARSRLAQAARQAQIRAALEEDTAAVLHEVRCELLWSALAPGEQQDVATLEARGVQQPTYQKTIYQEAGETVGEAVGKALRLRAARIAGAQYGLVEEWSQYGDDLAKKATADFDNEVSVLGETVEIDEGLYTRALFYYARSCLRPPH